MGRTCQEVREVPGNIGKPDTKNNLPEISGPVQNFGTNRLVSRKTVSFSVGKKYELIPSLLGLGRLSSSVVCSTGAGQNHESLKWCPLVNHIGTIFKRQHSAGNPLTNNGPSPNALPFGIWLNNGKEQSNSSASHLRRDISNAGADKESGSPISRYAISPRTYSTTRVTRISAGKLDAASRDGAGNNAIVRSAYWCRRLRVCRIYVDTCDASDETSSG